MSFIRFTHETSRHWSDQENETCRWTARPM